MIKVKEVVHEYFRRDNEDNILSIDTALNHVSFEIAQGEFVAVLGHNGSGKSTLAKHMNAILLPGEGGIWIDEINTKDGKHLMKIRQSVGMVFQNPDNQIIHNVVEDDVGFGPENLGVPTKKIWERVEEALKKVAMWKYRKKSPNNLSGGQKQRVAIAGILAMKPRYIVLDEATAMLDPIGRKEVLSSVKELNKKEKITVLWITHHMEEVIQADRILVMNEGKIEMQGTPKEIFTRVDELHQLHLDVPQVTYLAYELKKEGFQIPDGILSVEELVEVLSFVLK